jgi:hypothetical protein
VGNKIALYADDLAKDAETVKECAGEAISAMMAASNEATTNMVMAALAVASRDRDRVA